MTLMALLAVCLFGTALYYLTCAFADVPTRKTSRMMLMAQRQGKRRENIFDVYAAKVSSKIAPYVRLDKMKRASLERTLKIAGNILTPESYIAKAWVIAGTVALCAVPMAFLIPLMVPVLIGVAVALWFSTYYTAFDYVKKRRKRMEKEIPRFALSIGQSLENDRDVLKILTSYRRIAGKEFGA